MLIDEVVYIDIESAARAATVNQYRNFGIVTKLSTKDHYIHIDQSSLDAALELIADPLHKSFIKMWFASNGSAIYAVNEETLNELSNPPFLSLIINQKNDQLKAYRAIPQELQAQLQLFFTVNKGTNLQDYPKGRNVFYFLDQPEGALAEYLAPYTSVSYYAKNNFKTSKLQGFKDLALDWYRSSNVGALLFWPSINQSEYFNIKDSAGFNLNLDFLRTDLETDVKNRMFTALQSDNSYSQSNISRLENVMAEAALWYEGLNLISSYKTSSIPEKMQRPQDRVNNIVRGFKLQYCIENEIAEIHCVIKEEL